MLLCVSNMIFHQQVLYIKKLILENYDDYVFFYPSFEVVKDIREKLLDLTGSA